MLYVCEDLFFLIIFASVLDSSELPSQRVGVVQISHTTYLALLVEYCEARDSYI